VRATSSRLLALTGLALVGSSAFAETYTAYIYSPPSGYTMMSVQGAGDNGLMSGYVQGPSGEQRAAYRTNSGSKLLHPTGWFQSQINESWGSTYHCGVGKPVDSDVTHALFWVGGGAAVDLHPAGAEYERSSAWSGFGQFQVGEVLGVIPCAECGIGSVRHAGIWNRTAASFMRLHSLTHQNTTALGTDGVHHVGMGLNRNDFTYNALYWNSSASMGVNIRPSMSTSSVAFAVSGGQQGGHFFSAATNGNSHACIWAGTAASAVDLNPNSAFLATSVKAVRNGLQVGNGRSLAQPNRFQAIAWHGTAGSWINLHSKLPYPFTLWSSFAEGIDNNGNIVGSVGTTGDVRPVIWIRS
jgi:hypothetical protein